MDWGLCPVKDERVKEETGVLDETATAPSCVSPIDDM